MNLLMMIPVLAVFLAPAVGSAACNVCHSKKPEMRRMHEALGYKECFACHGPAAKPFDRRDRQNDQRCLPCHGK